MATMTKPHAAAAQYLRTHVQSSSPLELIVLLYDGAIRSADAARDAIVRRDVRARKAAMSRLLGILAELQNSLDLERGGAIAKDLDRLYAWATARLMDAVVVHDPRPVQEVRRVLETLREAWQAIAAPPPGPTP